jgi:hypothetical protein
MFQLFDKGSGFIKEMDLWKSVCESGRIEMFVIMSEEEENDYEFEEIKLQVLIHLTNIESNQTDFFS